MSIAIDRLSNAAAAEAKLAEAVAERDDAYRCKHERDRRIGELMAEVGYLTRERNEARAKLAKVVEILTELDSEDPLPFVWGE